MSVSCKSIGGRERNGMNERSNGSCERPPAYKDNLFAVIRMAKETIWRSRQSNPPISCCRNTFHASWSGSGASLYTCTKVNIPFFKDPWSRQKFLHFGGATANIPFSRVVFANRMRPTGRKLFAEIGILFTAFAKYRRSTGSTSFHPYVFPHLRTLRCEYLLTFFCSKY